jgi:trehalose synthase
VFQVDVPARALSPFVELVGAARVEAIAAVADATRAALGRHTVWNINSTAAGGGVAEVLRSLLTYSRGLGVEVRWLVIEGPPEFFAITKRLHNALHDNAGDGSKLGAEQAALYERVLADNVAQLEDLVRPGDAVICHDPQTAGLVPHLRRLGERVVWRCHIGHEGAGREVDLGWAFLRKYLEDVPLAVFSRAAYAPSWIPRAHAVTLPPNIDPFSVKNQWISDRCTQSILATIGIVERSADGRCSVYVREDGTIGEVRRPVEVIRMGDPPPWSAPLVVQVSRWDRMKDHVGVLEGFARLLDEQPRELGAQLVLAGPSAGGVADDPESTEVLREIEHAWRSRPERVRRRVQVVQLPMTDTDENAAMVNALQRHASVIVQKSLREGFGLTVTEAMWKRRPIVASAVGGIQDQIRDGVEGLLVHDPTDAAETARALWRVLESPDLGRRLGAAARERVRERYLSIASLERWGRLIQLLYRG